jgi:VIT1/CCC1 family predicted Fe2+/Mn2+ transporter
VNAEPSAARLGIAFGVWFLILLYLLINGIWLGVAAAVLAGVAIVFIAISVSKRGINSR